MIIHQSPGQNPSSCFKNQSIDPGQEISAILIIAKDLHLFYPSGHDMVKGPGGI
jgi:hypothetical protein